MTGPTGQIKELIDLFFVNGYERLVDRIERQCKDKTKADDLSSYVVDRLYSGSEAVAKVIVQGATAMEYWCNQLIYESANGIGKFQRLRSDKVVSIQELDGCNIIDLQDSAVHSLSFVIPKEPEPEFFFKSFLEMELVKSGLDEKDVDRRMRLQSVVNELSPWELELYRLYYEQRMTHRQIAELKKMPKTSVYNLLRSLRSKLNLLLGTTVSTRYLY